MRITWTKAMRYDEWTGAIGTANFTEANKFDIVKVKPGHAPKHHAGMRVLKWNYEYVMHMRVDGIARRHGTYTTLAEAKAAAEAALLAEAPF